MKTNNQKIDKCVICNETLTGKQKKFCSRACHNKCGNKKYQDCVNQHLRGIKRKIELVEMMGGSCAACGYDRNYAALSFHHMDKSKKSFQLDIRHCSNRKWDSLLEEVKKCKLLCVRCHAEEHNPGLFKQN